MTYFARWQPVQTGYIHAVIVDKVQRAIIGDEQISCLQVPVSHACSSQITDHIVEAEREVSDGGRLINVAAYPAGQRESSYPVHPQNGITRSFYLYTAWNKLEVGRPPRLQLTQVSTDQHVAL